MTLQSYIGGLREKPEHVRKQIAFGAAALGTALVALLWMIGAATTGTFALNAGGKTPSAAVPSAANYGLAGAAGALPGTSAPAPAHLEVVGQEDTSAKADAGAPASEQTVIPF